MQIVHASHLGDWQLPLLKARLGMAVTLHIFHVFCWLQDLFCRITALSYTGDVRMGLAEDSKKVERIVEGSYQQFQQVYTPLLNDPQLQHLGLQYTTEGQVVQDTSVDARIQLLSWLPTQLLQAVATSAKVHGVCDPITDRQRLLIASAAAESGHYERLVLSGLQRIVNRSSARQAMVGLLSAGLGKSVQYMARKFSKAWRR